MKPSSPRKPLQANLYLVGLMGTGKSTIGRTLAQHLGMTFMDSDQMIEKKSGLSVSEIFDKHGESYFRKLEREFIEGQNKFQNCVVACGGGLCIPRGMMEGLRSLGIVVCLWASVETLVERTRTNKDRPLLQVSDPYKALQGLLKERESRYREADLLIETDDLTTDEVVDNIVERLSPVR